MPVDKQVIERYRVLNECFRNPYRDYNIDDLVDECNKALHRLDKPEVSKRTIQNDIVNMETDYGIRLNEKLRKGRQRIYRCVNTDSSIHLVRMNDKERHKIQDAIYVLRDFEGEPLYDWARAFLMQIEGGLFNEDNTPVVSFQTNPDLKGISYFSELLQAILTKRVLKLRYTPYGKDTQTVNVYPYHLKQFNDRWYLIAQDRKDQFAEIVTMIQHTRNEVVRLANASLIDLYWRVGKYISDKISISEWGDGVVKQLADYIERNSPEVKGFSDKNLWRMKQFYETYKDADEKLSALLRQISWTNNLIIMSRTKSSDERFFYLTLCQKEHLSKRELNRQIDKALYERSKKEYQKSHQ